MVHSTACSQEAATDSFSFEDSTQTVVYALLLPRERLQAWEGSAAALQSAQ